MKDPINQQMTGPTELTSVSPRAEMQFKLLSLNNLTINSNSNSIVTITAHFDILKVF